MYLETSTNKMTPHLSMPGPRKSTDTVSLDSQSSVGSTRSTRKRSLTPQHTALVKEEIDDKIHPERLRLITEARSTSHSHSGTVMVG